MQLETGKKSLLILLCVIQIAVLFLAYQAFNLGLPLKQTIIQTWNVLETRGDNLRRSVWGSLLHSNVTNLPAITNDIQLAKVANQTVHFDIIPDLIRNPFLLILVLTTPRAFLRRHVIRTTWGYTHRQVKLNRSAVFQGEIYDLTKLKLVFVVGRSNDIIINTSDKLEKEARRYGDILQVSRNESYRGIVYKVLWAYSWALTLNPQFILKADHDVYIDIRHLTRWLLEPLPTLLYTGFVHSGVIVGRDTNSPYYVSTEELSRDTYPDYCAGPSYVMSRKFVSYVINSSSIVKVFRVEDAYMGVIADHLGVSPYRTSEFFWNRGVESNIKSWDDNTLSRYFCIGDSLETETITYLHFRYMQLDSTG